MGRQLHWNRQSFRQTDTETDSSILTEGCLPRGSALPLTSGMVKTPTTSWPFFCSRRNTSAPNRLWPITAILMLLYSAWKKQTHTACCTEPGENIQHAVQSLEKTYSMLYRAWRKQYTACWTQPENNIQHAEHSLKITYSMLNTAWKQHTACCTQPENNIQYVVEPENNIMCVCVHACVFVCVYVHAWCGLCCLAFYNLNCLQLVLFISFCLQCLCFLYSMPSSNF